MPKVFISHSWEDNDIARKLAEYLKRDGIDIWIDYAEIKSGDSLPNRIGEALEWCDTIILLWSKSASKSYYVQLEWQSALSIKRYIIPCVLDDSKPPAILSSLHYITFLDFNKGYNTLIRALGVDKKSEDKAEVSRSFKADPEVYEITLRPRNKIFISYCHRDNSWLERLCVHLKPLERDNPNKIDVWDDRKIRAGSMWREEIRNALNSAGIAILLISADFLASDFIMKDEVPNLISAAKNEGAIILPIIISPCLFRQIKALSEYEAVNDPIQPLISMNEYEQEKLFLEVALFIMESLLNR